MASDVAAVRRIEYERTIVTDSLTQTIAAIHAAPTRIVLVITGGGSGALSKLLEVPGASRTVVAGLVPYANAALIEFLGHEPEKFCDESTALTMAVTAYQRAVALVAAEDNDDLETPADLLGIAATASLVSDRPKRGDHRALVAIQSSTATQLARLDLEKDARDRPGEEGLVASLIIDRLADVAGIEMRPALPLGDLDRLTTRQTTAATAVADVWNGRRSITWSLPDGRWADTPPASPAGILSGSFAPRHEGHVGLLQVAEHILAGPVYYELPVVNADKPPLDYDSIECRRRVFTDKPLAITASATFEEKAAVFPGTMFVVGADTAERVIDPAFYDGAAKGRDAAMASIRDHGCGFLVAGRQQHERFQDLTSLSVPASFTDLFTAIPSDRFRCDISSTEIRNDSA
jgi:hypothetical protein